MVLALSTLTAALSCRADSGTGPKDSDETPSGPIAIDAIVGGKIASAGAAVRYTFVAAARQEYAAFFAASSGELLLTVLDPTGKVLVSVPGGSSTDSLEHLVSPPFRVERAATLTALITGLSSTDTGHFKLRISRVDRAPEHHTARVAVGDTVSGESLENAADIDEFVFAGRAGQEINLFVQALDPADAGTLVATVTDIASDASLGSVASAGGDSDFEGQSTGRIVLPVAKDYRITVRSGERSPYGNGSYYGPYRLWIYPISRVPEQSATQVAVGDTIATEAIDHVGDIDEFTLRGTSGQEVNIFFQTHPGSPDAYFTLQALGSQPETQVMAKGIDTSLTANATGTVTIPSSGTLTLRISAPTSSAAFRGPYRFWPYLVNRRPEHAPATLTLGDSIKGETIEVPGDIDEFTLVVPRAAPMANIGLFVDERPTTDFFALDVVSQGQTIRAAEVHPSLDPRPPLAAMTDVLPLAAGTYTLRVHGGTSRGGGFAGNYRFRTWVGGTPAPEHAPEQFAIGDTITESIDSPGDVDIFHFAARRGEAIAVAIQAIGESTLPPLGLVVNYPIQAGVMRYIAGVEAPFPSSTLGQYMTQRLIYPSDDTGEIVVSSDGRFPNTAGTYRLTILRLPTAPEHRSPMIAVGDSIANERLDAPGDVDDFMLTGTPGQEVVAFLQSSESTSGMMLQVLDSTHGAVLRSTPSYGFEESTGRFTLPASGRVLLRLMQPGVPCTPGDPCPVGGLTLTGPYRFHTKAIDRAPEHAPSAIAIGDTISDAIDPPGDIDEYTFSGSAGQRVVAYFQTPHGVSIRGDALELAVLDPVTSQVLGSVRCLQTEPLSANQTAFTLPRSGMFMIRVQGVDERGSAGEYRFLLQTP